MANGISGIRIVCALGLIFCPTFSAWFYVLYIIAGLSDVLDGLVARGLGKETKLGAQLDTIADIVFALIVIIKVVCAVSFPLWLILWIIGIAVVKCYNIVIGFVMHKRFVSEHTVLNKMCGILLFVIPLCIGWFPQRPMTISIIFISLIATVAAVQEGYYIRKGKMIN